MLSALALTVLLVLSAPARAKVVLLNAGGAVVATPVRDPYTTLVGWSDDGTALLVRREDRMLRLDLAGGATARLAPLDDALSVGPSGRAIVVHGTFDSARVELRETDGRLLGAQTVRADFRARPSAAWSPDGRRVAVAVPPHLLVFDTFSGVPVLRRTLTEPGLARQAFSPDAAALLVSDGPRVLRIDLPSGADSVAVRLPKDSVGVAAVWGAGGRIAVTHDARLRISGTPAVATRLPVIALDDPLWNKDGSALAYTFIAPARYDCELPRYGVGQLTPGGAPQTLLAPSGAAVRAVAWSPDGQTLAVDTDRDFSLERRAPPRTPPLAQTHRPRLRDVQPPWRRRDPPDRPARRRARCAAVPGAPRPSAA